MGDKAVCPLLLTSAQAGLLADLLPVLTDPKSLPAHQEARPDRCHGPFSIVLWNQWAVEVAKNGFTLEIKSPYLG